MRSQRRNISVFSISALDLFAAALGAFILIVLVLFPYYRLGGTDISFEELEKQVQKRRLAAASTQTELSVIRVLQAEIRLLNKQYKSTQEKISETEIKIREIQKQISEVEIPEPPPTPLPIPEPQPDPVPPRNVGQGVEFSILGVGTDKKRIAIVVDMSGSMRAHTDAVKSALNEILEQMQADYQFAIIGYRGGPTYDSFPRSGRLETASADNIARAQQFIAGLPRRFGGGTPTQNALLRALNIRPDAIILLSDGAPDDGSPASIINNISRRNRGQSEIHTVAIGDYTRDKNLTLFLQELASLNNGEFVGRAR